MRDWKETCRRLLSPPVWLMIVLILVSAASLVAVFLNGWEESILAYVVYVVSFYTLTVTVIYCAGVLPSGYKTVKGKLYGTRFGYRYMTDVAFKTHVSLSRSLGMNLLYVAVNLLSGLLYRSVWFLILAGYYAILSVMRFLLVRFVDRVGIGKERLGELRRSRVCAWILLLVNVTLSCAVVMMMYQGRGSEYAGVLIYVMALYTFYITVSAVMDLFKYRKYESPVMSASKIISLTAALVSMLNLETAMLSAFGAEEMSVAAQRTMIAATGAGVSVVVIVLAVLTIVRTSREIRETSR